MEVVKYDEVQRGEFEDKFYDLVKVFNNFYKLLMYSFIIVSNILNKGINHVLHFNGVKFDKIKKITNRRSKY